MAAVLDAGFPLVAFLQVLHVYGQALRQIADAEARLFRIYVHEPLIKDGVPSTQMSEEMGELIAELLPQTTPLMVYLHRSFLRHSVEQDVIANMWSDLLDDEREALGQLRVAIVFADLVGFVRFTEEEGEEEALDLVESFVTSVEESLPGSARVVKNIGDGVMIVGNDPVALTDWAIGFQEGFERRSRPRIGIHYGRTVYRDGDYFGGNVNLASRVVARAHAGEVLVTDTVVDGGGRAHRPGVRADRRGAAQGLPGADVAVPARGRPRPSIAPLVAASALAFASASRARWRTLTRWRLPFGPRFSTYSTLLLRRLRARERTAGAPVAGVVPGPHVPAVLAAAQAELRARPRVPAARAVLVLHGLHALAVQVEAVHAGCRWRRASAAT